MNATAAAIAQLTAKGRETMEAIGLQELSFFDEGVVEGSGSWGGSISGDMGHHSSGVINRLRDMGLFRSEDVGDYDLWWTLTELGAAVANELVRPTQTEELPLELDNTNTNTNTNQEEGTDMGSTTEFAVSTSRDGSTKIHKMTCKKQPQNAVPAATVEAFEDAVPASCCKPKFTEYVAELRAQVRAEHEAKAKAKAKAKARAAKPAKPAPADAKTDERSDYVTVTVAWTPNVAKLFFRALAKEGTRDICEEVGVEHKSNETHQRVELTGDPVLVAALAELLPGWWDGMNEELRTWRKTSPEYKAFNLRDKQGAKDAFQAEQDQLRQMCRKLAGWILAHDGEFPTQRVWVL